MQDKINEFEDRLNFHKAYSFKRYNQLKNVLTYLQLFFIEGGTLTDKQVQLDLEMEVESEIEALRTLRYSENKTEDFISSVDAALRIVSILKNYIPVEDFVPYTSRVGVFSRLKQVFDHQKEPSVFDLIWRATATWSH